MYSRQREHHGEGQGGSGLGAATATRQTGISKEMKTFIIAGVYSSRAGGQGAARVNLER